jgi:hypothetical protein
MKRKLKSLTAALITATMVMSCTSFAFAEGVVRDYNGNGIELSYNDVNGEFSGTKAASFSKDSSPLASVTPIDYVIPDEINGTKLKTIIRNGFFDCDTMKSIKFPTGLTSIGEKAFLGCDLLESVTIPNSVTELGEDIFESCDSLESAKVGNGVGTIPSKLFFSCKNLKNVELDDNITSIGASAFAACKSIEEIELPSKLTELSDSSFKDCTSLTSIVIPEGVTTIPANCFSGCKSLRSVTLPSTINTIGKNAFKDCVSLKSIRIGETCRTIDKTSFDGCKNITIYCVPGSKVALFADTNKIKTANYNDESNVEKDENKDASSQISVTDDNYKYTEGNNGVLLKVNGKYVDCGTAEPVIQNGSTLVPMRPLLSAIGCKSISWDKDTKTVKAATEDIDIALTVGDETALVNGAKIKMITAPQIINSSTYIPARFVSEAFGLKVVWDAETKTVVVTE